MYRGHLFCSQQRVSNNMHLVHKRGEQPALAIALLQRSQRKYFGSNSAFVAWRNLPMFAQTCSTSADCLA